MLRLLVVGAHFPDSVTHVRPSHLRVRAKGGLWDQTFSETKGLSIARQQFTSLTLLPLITNYTELNIYDYKKNYLIFMKNIKNQKTINEE